MSTKPSKPSKRPKIAVIVAEAMGRHGPTDDDRLAAILRNSHGLKPSSVRGRRAELVRAGEVERVGETQDGRGVYDIKGIKRTPAVPLEQKTLWS